MKRKTLKKALSAFLSLLMCMMTLLSISTPVFAATTVDAYMVDFPRDGDSNYSATAWGHSATSLMGGWRFLNSKYTTVHSIGTENADAASQNVQEQDSGRPTVGGIPVMHIILFGGGLLLAAGSLVAMRFIRNRRPSERSPYDPDDEDDDEDEYEY